MQTDSTAQLLFGGSLSLSCGPDIVGGWGKYIPRKILTPRTRLSNWVVSRLEFPVLHSLSAARGVSSKAAKVVVVELGGSALQGLSPAKGAGMMPDWGTVAAARMAPDLNYYFVNRFLIYIVVVLEVP